MEESVIMAKDWESSVREQIGGVGEAYYGGYEEDWVAPKPKGGAGDRVSFGLTIYTGNLTLKPSPFLHAVTPPPHSFLLCRSGSS